MSCQVSIRLRSGSGPLRGWISTQLSGRQLAVRMPDEAVQLADHLDGRAVLDTERLEEERAAHILEKGTKHVQSFMCEVGNMSVFSTLKDELSQGQRLFSGNWKPGNDGKWKTPWRNGLGSEQVEDLNGCKLPGLAKTLQKLCELVNADMQQWWANYYEDGSVGCEFHHDGHAEFNITAGASFGASRYLTFQHEHTQLERSYLQQNGDVFAFDARVDENFLHGVYPVDAEVGPRISIIIMGRCRTGQGIHRNFLQDQQSHRLEFASSCREKLVKLQQAIAAQDWLLGSCRRNLRSCLRMPSEFRLSCCYLPDKRQKPPASR